MPPQPARTVIRARAPSHRRIFNSPSAAARACPDSISAAVTRRLAVTLFGVVRSTGSKLQGALSACVEGIDGDHEPGGGRYPLRLWLNGDHIHDEQRITIDAPRVRELLAALRARAGNPGAGRDWRHRIAQQQRRLFLVQFADPIRDLLQRGEQILGGPVAPCRILLYSTDQQQKRLALAMHGLGPIGPIATEFRCVFAERAQEIDAIGQ